MPGTVLRNAFQTHSQSPQTIDVGLGQCGGTITVISQRCNTGGQNQGIVHNKVLECLSIFQFFFLVTRKFKQPNDLPYCLANVLFSIKLQIFD